MDGWTTATIMAWIKVDDTYVNSGQDRIVGQQYFNLHLNGGGTTGAVARATIRTIGGANYQIGSNVTEALNTGQWYHLTAVYDGPNGNFNLYVNGSKANGSFSG